MSNVPNDVPSALSRTNPLQKNYEKKSWEKFIKRKKANFIMVKKYFKEIYESKKNYLKCPPLASFFRSEKLSFPSFLCMT